MVREVLENPDPARTFLLKRGLFPTNPRTRLAEVGLLLLVVAAAAAPTLDHGLVWDDLHFLDPERGVLWGADWLRELWTEPMWAGSSTSSIPPYYRPLGLTLLRLEGSPGLSHAVQVGLHGLNTVLVARLAKVWGAKRIAALLAGAAFAVHPAGVEVFSWLSARGDALGTTLALVALLVVHDRRGETRRAVAFGILVFFALLVKESFVVLPLLAAIRTGSMRVLASGGLAIAAWAVLWGSILWAAGSGESAALDLRFLSHGLLLLPYLLFGPAGRTAGYLPGALPAHWLYVWVAVVVTYIYCVWSAGSRAGRRDLASVAVSLLPALAPLLMLGGRSGDRYVYFTLALLLAGAATRLRPPRHLLGRVTLVVVCALTLTSGIVAARAQAELWADPQLRLLRPRRPDGFGDNSTVRDPVDVGHQLVEFATGEHSSIRRHLDQLTPGEVLRHAAPLEPLGYTVLNPLAKLPL